MADVIEGKPAIAVVGPDRDDLEADVLDAARRAAASLAREGYVVVTRAGAGVSKAAANAALDADGDVVLVAAGPEPGNHVPAGDGVTVVETGSPLSALAEILERADAAMVVAPDVESLALVCQIWAFGQTPQAPYRQIVLVGEAWRGTVKTLADAAQLDARTRAMVTFADTPEEGVESLRYFIAP